MKKFIQIAIVPVLIVCFFAFQNPQQKTVTLTLTEQEVKTVLEGLRGISIYEGHDLSMKISRQLKQQLNPEVPKNLPDSTKNRE